MFLQTVSNKIFKVEIFMIHKRNEREFHLNREQESFFLSLEEVEMEHEQLNFIDKNLVLMIKLRFFYIPVFPLLFMLSLSIKLYCYFYLKIFTSYLKPVLQK